MLCGTDKFLRFFESERKKLHGCGRGESVKICSRRSPGNNFLEAQPQRAASSRESRAHTRPVVTGTSAHFTDDFPSNLPLNAGPTRRPWGMPGW